MTRHIQLAAGILIGFLLVLVKVSETRAWPELPPDRAFVSGPGIKGQIQITDKQVLNILRLGGIEDFRQGPIEKPRDIGSGFRIIRYFEDGEFRMGDLTYYPNGAGARSVVFYDDGAMLNGDRSPNHKKWLYTVSESDPVLQVYLKSLGATLPKMQEQKKSIVVGEPATVEFTLSNASEGATVVLKPSGNSERIIIAAHSSGSPGRYQFRHVFNHAGIWDWSVQTDYKAAEIPMEALVVIDSAASNLPEDNQSAQDADVIDDAKANGQLRGYEPTVWGVAVLAGVVGIVGLVGVAFMAKWRIRKG